MPCFVVDGPRRNKHLKRPKGVHQWSIIHIFFLDEGAALPTWSPQKTESLPFLLLAYTPVCLITPSRIVICTARPLTVMLEGSFTPGLLLFSAPGRGASRVPFPAVWNMAALMVPSASLAEISRP